jgi:hypothetical protein
VEVVKSQGGKHGQARLAMTVSRIRPTPRVRVRRGGAPGVAPAPYLELAYFDTATALFSTVTILFGTAAILFYTVHINVYPPPLRVRAAYLFCTCCTVNKRVKRR